jgi:acyl-ACP thioesterase
MRTRLEQDYYLRALDTDVKGDWMPSAIFVRMQEIAEDHAAGVGLGRVDIVDKLGLGWVLVRMSLRMRKYPKIGETIRVATWPLKPARLIFRRQFMFWDRDGGELGRASSQWVLFDVAERMIRRTDAVGDYPYDPDEPPVLDEPGKIILPAGMEKQCSRTVLYSDVDMNRHMNNTKYLNWICELFPAPLPEQKSIESVRINYVAEARLGQEVDLFMKDAGDGCFICGKTGEKTVFDAVVSWMG